MILVSEATKTPAEVEKIARFLGFFAACRAYRPIDMLSRPFSYDDVVNTINDALRQYSVAYSTPDYTEKRKVNEHDIEIRYIRLRIGGIEKLVRLPAPPSSETVKKFLELCKEDLTYARIAASLAMTYGFRYLKEEVEEESEEKEEVKIEKEG